MNKLVVAAAAAAIARVAVCNQCPGTGRAAGLWPRHFHGSRQEGAGRRRGRSQEEQLAGGHRHRRQFEASSPRSHKMDNTQHGSVDIAIGKATTANNLRRPTKALQDTVAQGGGGLRVLAVARCVAAGGRRADHRRRQDHRRHWRLGRGVSTRTPRSPWPVLQRQNRPPWRRRRRLVRFGLAAIVRPHFYSSPEDGGGRL